MLTAILLLILAVVVGFVVAVASRPATFHVERRTNVLAPAGVIFAHLDDLHRWAEWNPFERSDPTTRITHSGAPSGVGASYHYVGGKAGEGHMTIVESQRDARLVVRADFIKPMRTTNQIVFTLQPTAAGVDLTWAMSGTNGFLGKALHVFIDMDRMVGGEFANGLADLKRLAEAEAASSPSSAQAAATPSVG